MVASYGRVFKNGNSQAISLSKQALNDSGFEIGDKVEVYATKNSVTFEKKELSIKEKIQEYYRNGGSYNEKEIDFGEDQGREKW